MLKEITKAVKAQKDSGAKKVRLIFSKMIDRNGSQVPKVTDIMEFELKEAFIKSGQLGAWLRTPISEMIPSATKFSVEPLSTRYDDEDGAFERQ